MKHIKSYTLFESQSIKMVWIHGLPGSGKSHLIAQMVQESSLDWKVFDDTASVEEIVSALHKGQNVILASPYFEEYTHTGLERELRSRLARFGDLELSEIWFSNDPDQCIENVLNRRGHGIDARSIVPEIPHFSKHYRIPSDATVVPVWRPEDEQSGWVD